ncbi:unnamed protein product [Colias eurytheme]|nr:unnamed protein product [Colias eurytheme]
MDYIPVGRGESASSSKMAVFIMSASRLREYHFAIEQKRVVSSIVSRYGAKCHREDVVTCVAEPSEVEDSEKNSSARAGGPRRRQGGARIDVAAVALRCADPSATTFRRPLFKTFIAHWIRQTVHLMLL